MDATVATLKRQIQEDPQNFSLYKRYFQALLRAGDPLKKKLESSLEKKVVAIRLHEETCLAIATTTDNEEIACTLFEEILFVSPSPVEKLIKVDTDEVVYFYQNETHFNSYNNGEIKSSQINTGRTSIKVIAKRWLLEFCEAEAGDYYLLSDCRTLSCIGTSEASVSLNHDKILIEESERMCTSITVSYRLVSPKKDLVSPAFFFKDHKKDRTGYQVIQHFHQSTLVENMIRDLDAEFLIQPSADSYKIMHNKGRKIYIFQQADNLFAIVDTHTHVIIRDIHSCHVDIDRNSIYLKKSEPDESDIEPIDSYNVYIPHYGLCFEEWLDQLGWFTFDEAHQVPLEDLNQHYVEKDGKYNYLLSDTTFAYSEWREVTEHQH